MNKYSLIWIVSILLPAFFIILTSKVSFIKNILPTGFLNPEVIILFILSLLIGFFAVWQFQAPVLSKILLGVLTVALVIVSVIFGLIIVFLGVR